ncbi:hypothetical protein C7455_108126 [Roseicyclus mahoneyensis]|jgi:hypothetical protein|uniref:Uncharacterized protein n=2 Tax=Roseicyclus mahoneyensis TaxID=164332 RepID=A0A316GEN9_9RHOB|nr:hypothetical protein C7455_108126 [Roseicyclus mahoneyensis]
MGFADLMALPQLRFSLGAGWGLPYPCLRYADGAGIAGIAMTSPRPPFTRAEIWPTFGWFLLGLCISLGVVGGGMLLYAGLWVLWPVFLFLAVLQTLFEGVRRVIGWSVRRGWRAIRGLPPLPTPPPERLPRTKPWLTAHAGWIGFILGGLWLVHGVWTDGVLP